MSKWGSPSGSEDNNNLKKTTRPPTMENIEFPPFYDYVDNNSAFQKIQQRPSTYRYQPYAYDRIPSNNLQQVQCDKCGYVCDQSMLAEHDATAHPAFYEYIKEEPQTEILDLDSHKVVYQPQGGEENIWLEQRYFKEENGNQSPDFGSVSTSMSSPTNSEVPYFEQQMVQLPSPQLPKYSVISKGTGGGTWKSNEPRRPKTYNCTACNKWFTSSGHLKRHYNTTLHKNAVKQSGVMDPASMPMSSHHHPPPQEEKYQYQPQQEQQEEYQEFYQYPNGMPPHTTNFIIDPLPSFNQIQSSRSGYSSVGGLIMAAVPVMPTPVQEHVGEPEVSSTSLQHKCVECDKTFNKACYLTQHNKSFHSGDKPFKCARCGKRFTQEYLHQEHLQKHAGDKPYKCDLCPKQFNHKTDLRRHMCLHSGNKPFACEFCNKGFIRKDHMLKHAVTHKKKAGLSSNYKKMEIDPTRLLVSRVM